MVYLQLLLGIGCVVIAAATAVYFSMPSPHSSHQNTRRSGYDHDDDNDNNTYGFKGDKSKGKQFHGSRPGDKCILCLEEMTTETMRTMHCGHALHDSRCYAEYRLWRRQCPYCNQLVIRIDLPGEDCAICCEPMKEETMEYMRCEHALHKTCLDTYKKNQFKTCPVCTRAL